MINSVVVTNQLGQTLTIEMRNPESSGFLIKNIEGLDPVKANINADEGGLTDGVVVNSTSIGSRNIIFTLVLLPLPTIESSRQRTYMFFPVRQKVTLRFISEERTATVVGYVESNDVNQFSSQVFATISIVCEKSYLTADKTDSLGFSFVKPKFKFPIPFGEVLQPEDFTNPPPEPGNEFAFEMGYFLFYRHNYTWRDPENGIGLVFDSGFIFQPTGYVYVTGEVKTGAEIELDFTGPVIDLIVTKFPTKNGLIDHDKPKQEMIFSSSRFIWLFGTGIDAGDKITINTKSGQKKVTLLRDGVFRNAMHVVGFPDWFEFEPGGSFLVITATSGTEYVHVNVTTPVLYEGI